MLDEPRLLAANPWVTRRPITVTEYHRMGEVGILGGAGGFEVCREPHDDGYLSMERFGRGDTIEPALLPGIRIQLVALFR
jgi:hypothetical protein